MADNSELEYLDTWLTEVTTSLVVETYATRRNVSLVSGSKKALIFPGELMHVDEKFFKKRYLVKLSLENEENIMSIINEVIAGCVLYNTGRAGLTSVDVMCNIHLAYAGRNYVEANGRWNQDLWLDVEWGIE